ncbi:MAG: rRNA pseudouridine synthase [Prevotellaceae bacterium]|jgi:23S rRNA pseudouridine2605 synthase|nr:rRNA pseudouridine synthase [Prevotellaceae bacterium]
MKNENPRRQSSANKRDGSNPGKIAPKRKKSLPDKGSVWRINSADSVDDAPRSRNRNTSKAGNIGRGKSKLGDDNKKTASKKNATGDNGRSQRAGNRTVKDDNGKNKSVFQYKNEDERYQRNTRTTTKRRTPDAKKGNHYDEKQKKIIVRGKKTGKDEVRLNKFIANSGICSRREADEFIHAGVITINGEVVTELGTKVKLTDDVRFNGQRLQGEKKVYILLNKPKGYVTTVEDPHADKTVMDLIEGACKERVYPVGRLDKNTTGVLLFTNDGELTKQLTHPSSNKLKVYHVFLDKKVTKNDLAKLTEGFDLEDGFIQADAAEYVEDEKAEVGLEIHSGRNRIVRRMFERLGYKVTKLDRVYFAGLTKKSLKRGEWRMLTPKEVNILKMGAFK